MPTIRPIARTRLLLHCHSWPVSADPVVLRRLQRWARAATKTLVHVWALPGMCLATARRRCAAVSASRGRARFTTPSRTRVGTFRTIPSTTSPTSSAEMSTQWFMVRRPAAPGLVTPTTARQPAELRCLGAFSPRSADRQPTRTRGSERRLPVISAAGMARLPTWRC